MYICVHIYVFKYLCVTALSFSVGKKHSKTTCTNLHVHVLEKVEMAYISFFLDKIL